jgi:hypothetical protein
LSDMANELTYELRSDGVLYTLDDSISALIKRKSPSRVQIELWRGDALVPPESGDLVHDQATSCGTVRCS